MQLLVLPQLQLQLLQLPQLELLVEQQLLVLLLQQLLVLQLLLQLQQLPISSLASAKSRISNVSASRQASSSRSDRPVAISLTSRQYLVAGLVTVPTTHRVRRPCQSASFLLARLGEQDLHCAHHACQAQVHRGDIDDQGVEAGAKENLAELARR